MQKEGRAFTSASGFCDDYDALRQYCRRWRRSTHSLTLCDEGRVFNPSKLDAAGNILEGYCCDTKVHDECKKAPLSRACIDSTRCLPLDISNIHETCVCSGVTNGTAPFAVCTSWSCSAVDSDRYKRGAPLSATYSCDGVAQTEPPYCAVWSGVKITANDMELVDCRCMGLPLTDYGASCSQWVCEYEGLALHRPALAWVAFGAVMGTVIMGCAAAVSSHAQCGTWGTSVTVAATVVLECVCVLLPATMRGGVFVLVATVACLVVSAAVVRAVYYVFKRRREKAITQKNSGAATSTQVLPVVAPPSERKKWAYAKEEEEDENSSLETE